MTAKAVRFMYWCYCVYGKYTDSKRGRGVRRSDPAHVARARRVSQVYT
jgi:hypothetical protein